MAELAWGSATHPGQLRPQNEDSLLATDGIFVVADGMGGHEAGEVASLIAVERVLADLKTEGLPTATTVVESIANANGDIFRAALANPAQMGMGTTMTVIALIGDPMAGRGAPNLEVNDEPGEVTPIVTAEPTEALVLANVGDSRTYLMRHGRMRRVTVDHSYVQELVATGHITEDEARTHPRRNIVTRALGIEPDVKVDWWTLPLIRGDRFLLCSDGLVDEVPDADIREALTTLADPQEAADRLVELANQAGGRDNISVIVVDVLEGDEPPDPTQEVDVVPVWAQEEDPTPAGSIEVDADGHAIPLLAGAAATAEAAAAPAPEKRRDRGPRRFLIGLLVAALLVASFAFVAAYARRGYYVDFNDEDVVTIYRGRTGGFLWFDPTVENNGPPRGFLTEESAELIDARPRFDSRAAAAEFITELDTILADEDATPTATTVVAPTSTTSTVLATTTTRPITTTTTSAATTTVP